MSCKSQRKRGTCVLSAGTYLAILVSKVVARSAALKDTGFVFSLASGLVALLSASASAQSPGVSLSQTNLIWGSQLVGTSNAKAVRLTNTGSGPLSITSIAITGTDGADFTQTNTCGSLVAAAAYCTISITFTPAATGMRTASVGIATNSACGPESISLSGTGTSQAVTLSPPSLAFGTQLVGTSNVRTVALTNTGTATLNISTIATTGDYAEVNNCGSSVAGGQSCTLNVTFHPITAGSRPGSIVVTDNVGGNSQTVSLSGVGTYVSLTPSVLSYPVWLVGTKTLAQPITLTNLGSTTLTITSIRTTGDFAETNTCGASVPAQGSCTISVTFTPSNSGSRLGSVAVSDSDLGSPQTTNMKGVGTLVSFLPASLNFGNQSVYFPTPWLAIVLTNNGPAQINVASIVASGDYAVSPFCGNIIFPHGSCLLSVTFTPSAAGIRRGYITVSDDDGGILQTVALAGAGVTYSSLVSISPHVASLTPSETLQFKANVGVTWTVDGIGPGNSTVGTISSTGLYTPPRAVGRHVIVASSTANPTQTDAAAVTVTAYSGTYTFQNDNGHTGQNLQENVLTTGNVNASQFGLLASYSVDGQVYAQPLYVAGVRISGSGSHNVVYVATEHDSVYAFDADNLSSVPLWQVSFINPSAGITTVRGSDVQSESVNPEIGITSTPAIDPSSGTLYVVAYTKENGNYVYRLHALDITSGAEKFGGPVVISASVPGTGQGSSAGSVPFNNKRQGQRPGLLLVNGVVYIAFASGHGDIEPWHGWVLGYNAQTLQQVAVFNTTPNGEAGGIWGAGGGMGADSLGNLFLATGNGTFGANSCGANFGDSFVKLTIDSGGPTVADYFTPSDQATLDVDDLDLGSGGVMLLPDQPSSPSHLLIGGGKTGVLYLVNRDNMGRFNPSTVQVVQEIPGRYPGIFSVVAYWNSNLYLAGVNDHVKQFRLLQGQLSTTPVAQATNANFPFPGATPAISANANTNGIAWLIQKADASSRAVLRAYDAANVSRELYDSDQAATRDQLPAGVKFAVPTIANGKVYVGTGSTLAIFGLLPQ
jgi:Abnormal spindle-like microcephaly-assoc'd, ASPM-SPD-2-Hydin